MLRTLEEKVDPKHAALLVIDMQNDFCHEDGTSAGRDFDVRPVQAIVPALQQAIAGARRAGVPIIFARFALTDDIVADNFRERLAGNPYPCREGTWGAEWYGVTPEPGDAVITKHRFSAFIGTDLELTLRTRGIKSLILAGTRTNICVECTARDGYQLDYYIVVLSDCTASDPQEHQAMLDRANKGFGLVATSEEIVAAWHRLRAPVAGAI